MADNETGVAAIRGNGFDPEIVRGYVQRIESLYQDLATEKGESMARCKVIHEDVAAVYDEAKKVGGVPKKALKTAIKKRDLGRKFDAVGEDLEGDDLDNYAAVLLAVGQLSDTPLGAAALAKAKAPEAATTA